MNVLARPEKASFHRLSEAASEMERAAERSQDLRPAASPRSATGVSIIGAGLSVVGRLHATGEIQIDGSVEGEIRGRGVRISSGATVKGSVIGETLHIAGTVEGSVEGESVTITKTAFLTGDLSYHSLQIEEGAHFNGNAKPARKPVVPQETIAVPIVELQQAEFCA